jgi:hypothetical protein
MGLLGFQFRWNPAIMMSVTGFPISCSRRLDGILKRYQPFLVFRGRDSGKRYSDEATGWMSIELWFRSLRASEVCLFTLCRLALGPTDPPVCMWHFFPWGKAAGLRS